MLQEIIEIRKFLKDERVQCAVKIGAAIRHTMTEFLSSRDFIEIPPVVISPVTDPLAHPIFDGEIRYYDNKYYLTRSMIFHKQMALLAFDKIFCFSPNIRFELAEKARTHRHLFEFTQLDLEIKMANREKVMKLAEEMLIYVFKKIKETCEPELEKLGRELKIPSRPFKRIGFEEAYTEYGEDYEEILSAEATEPFWIVDFPKWKREFYDRESEEKKGWLADMDLIYPEGFGEALSGGEREYEYEKIIKRIQESGVSEKEYILYLEVAKQGLPPSAGFGIGIERLTRYICGLGDIRYATLFPKIPGKYCI